MTQVAERVEASATEAPDSPYVGLTPFTENDAQFFFGRDTERRIIAANLMASRLTLLYGASGVGKSSILRAGLQRDFRDKVQRALAESRPFESILVVFAAWRDDPIAGLAAAVETSVRTLLGKVAPEPPPRGLRLDELLAEWNRRLDERAASLADPELLAAGEEPRTELLIVLDQFEQYFLYHGDEDGDGTFAVEFPRAINREDLRAHFLISLREDAYAQLDRFEGRILNLFGSNLRIEHLDRAAAQDAIVKPIDRYNDLLPAGEERYAIEPELVTSVLDEVKAGSIVLGHAGSGTVRQESSETGVETPFLQLVLERLWAEERSRGSHTLHVATLDELGGAEEIVRTHLEAAMETLTPEERAIAARVFRQLVTPSGTKIVHRTRDLAGYAETDEATLLPILEQLDSERVLRSIDAAPGDKTPRFEIRHDVLAAAVLEWVSRWEEGLRQAEAAAKQQHELEEEKRQQRTRLVFRSGIAISILFVLALVLGIFALVSYFKERKLADESRSDGYALQVLASIASGGDPAANVHLASKALRTHTTSAAEQAFRAAVMQPHVQVIGATSHNINAAVFSPAGTTIATADGVQGATIVDAATGRLLHAIDPGQHAALNVAFNHAGTLVATADDDGVARIWSTASGRLVMSFGKSGYHAVEAVAFSPDGQLLATAGDDGVLRVWSLKRPGVTPVATFGRGKRLLTVAFSPDARFVAAAGDDGRVRVWSVTRPTAPARAFGSGKSIGRIAFSPDGTHLVAAHAGGTTAVWTVTGTQTLRGPAHTGGLTSVAFSPDGRFLLTAGTDGTRIWDASSGGLVAYLTSNQPIVDAAFSPDGREVVTAGTGFTVWDAGIETHPQATVLERSAQSASSSAFSPTDGIVATAASDGVVRIRRIGARTPAVALHTPSGFVSGVAFSADGKRIVVASNLGTATVWDTASGARVAKLGRAGLSLDGAAISPDGSLVLTTAGDGTVRIWRVADGALVAVLKQHSPEIVAAGFSPDGKTVLTAGIDGTVSLWRSSDGGARSTLNTPGGSLTSAAFSPDGTRVVAVVDGNAIVWDGTGWSRRTRFAYPGSSMTTAAFSPDGKLLATGDNAGVVAIWNLKSRQLVLQLAPAASKQQIVGVRFSPDGRFLLAADADGLVRIADVTATTSSDVPLLGVLQTGGGGLESAAFSPDDRYVLTTSKDGTRLFACEPCLPLPALVDALERDRSWTSAQLDGS